MDTAFQPKITRVRFVVIPYTPVQMSGIGQDLIGLNFARWDRGLDARDGGAKPLAAKYARRKANAGRRGAVRDLNFTGRLRSSIQVLNAAENRVTIGPIEGVYTTSGKGRILSNSQVLTFNQQRARMWGLSPNDRTALVEQMLGIHQPVVARTVTVP